MFARSLRVLPFALLLLPGCGVPPGGPDGGQQGCELPQTAFLVVKVEEQNGSAVVGATVQGHLPGASTVATGLTNMNGVSTAVTSNLGSGTVSVTATLDTRTSNTATANFVCGNCGCTVDPTQVTLTMNP